jgi:hypothetical protein
MICTWHLAGHVGRYGNWEWQTHKGYRIAGLGLAFDAFKREDPRLGDVMERITLELLLLLAMCTFVCCYMCYFVCLSLSYGSKKGEESE